MSSDGGAVWTSLDTFLYEGGCCLVMPESAHIVISGGNMGVMPDPPVLCVSRDSGRNWSRYMLSDQFGMVRTLATAGGLIYAGGQVGDSGAVFTSDDYGLSWKRSVAPPARSVRSIAAHPEDAGKAYAAAGDGIYCASDQGETWTRILETGGLRSIRLFPGCPDTIFVAGSSGVLMSADRGSNWQEWNDGLANTDVTTLEFCAEEDVRLIAGTLGDACYQWSFATGIESSRLHGPSAIFRLSPNPCRGKTVLHYVPRSLDPSVPISVFDASGRLVLQSEVCNLPSEIALDLRGLPAGTYAVRFSVGGRSTAKKLVIQP